MVSIVGTCGQPVASTSLMRSTTSPLGISPALPKRLLNVTVSRKMGVTISCLVTMNRSVPCTANTGAWSCMAR